MLVIFDKSNQNLVLSTFDNRGKDINGDIEDILETIQQQAIGTSSVICCGYSALRLLVGDNFNNELLG